MKLNCTPQPQQCINIMKAARTSGIYSNKKDISNVWTAPSVGIFWCNQSSVQLDPSVDDAFQFNNYYHCSGQGAVPLGGHVNIGIMGNQVFVVLELPKWAKADHQISHCMDTWSAD
eukprot:1237275-Heterocapsa_arctica.AAC.1